MQSQVQCFKCGESLSLGTQVGFKECCPKCDSDLHCCKNCTFYDSNAYNSCRESQADRVVDKEKANFCDYFKISGGVKNITNSISDKKSKVQSLEDLFKK